MGLLTDTIAEMGLRSLPNYRTTVPRFCVSIGAHVLNLRHKGVRLVLQGETHQPVEDDSLEPIDPSATMSLRVHFMLVGEPGTGKDIWRYQFFEGDWAIVRGLVPYMTGNRVTDAGLAGQKLQKANGTWEWDRGLLDKYKHHIMFWGEFDNVLKASKSHHSSGIVNTLLPALDSGEVITTQGGVHDHHETLATLIGCNQPRRFEDVSGFDRRFIFGRNPDPVGPLEEWYKRMFAAHRRGDWQDRQRADALRDRWTERLTQAYDIDRVRIGQDLEDYVCSNARVPLPLTGIIYNSAIAYHFIDTDKVTSDFVVPLTPGIEKLIEEIVIGRSTVNMDPRVLEAMRENDEGKTTFRMTLKRDGIATGILAAGKMIETCVANHIKDGIRFVRVHRGGGRPLDIPTGLPRAHFEEAGYVVLGEFDHRGERLDEPEAAQED